MQVVQFMAEHAFNNPGGYTYHHCAELQIAGDPKKLLDKGWPAERQYPSVSAPLQVLNQLSVLSSWKSFP